MLNRKSLLFVQMFCLAFLLPTAVAAAESRTLYDAIKRNDVAYVKLLTRPGIGRHEGLNFRDENGDTPLHRAVMQGSAEMVGLLCAAGADVEARNFEDDTPLYKAVLHRSIPAASILITYRANVNAIVRRGLTVLHVRYNHSIPFEEWMRMVLFMIKCGADINAKERIGWGWPAFFSHLIDLNDDDAIRMIQFLFVVGADFNTREDSFRVPWLHLACVRGLVKSVAQLILLGADFNIASCLDSRHTPMYNTVIGFNPERIVQVLASAGAIFTYAAELNKQPSPINGREFFNGNRKQFVQTYYACKRRIDFYLTQPGATTESLLKADFPYLKTLPELLAEPWVQEHRTYLGLDLVNVPVDFDQASLLVNFDEMSLLQREDPMGDPEPSGPPLD
jgi:ankyrin repeat protein